VKVPLPALVHVLSHANGISDHAKPRRTNKADQVMAQEDWPETDVGGGAVRLPAARAALDLKRCKSIAWHLVARMRLRQALGRHTSDHT
jgi:hypothetical protein